MCNDSLSAAITRFHNKSAVECDDSFVVDVETIKLSSILTTAECIDICSVDFDMKKPSSIRNESFGVDLDRNTPSSMGLLPNTQNCGLRMRRECRERVLRHRFQRKPLDSDPDMHHGTCVKHVPWCTSGSLTNDGGENIPGIPGACATRNFAYLVRGPCPQLNRRVHCQLRC